MEKFKKRVRRYRKDFWYVDRIITDVGLNKDAKIWKYRSNKDIEFIIYCFTIEMTFITF